MLTQNKKQDRREKTYLSASYYSGVESLKRLSKEMPSHLIFEISKGGLVWSIVFYKYIKLDVFLLIDLQEFHINNSYLPKYLDRALSAGVNNVVSIISSSSDIGANVALGVAALYCDW